MNKTEPREIERHIGYLAETIGPRLAGSSEERAAAEYIAESFRECGAAVAVEEFPVRSRNVTEESLAFYRAGTWHTVPCSTLGGSIGTDGREIEADLIVVEPPMLRRDSYELYRGRAVMLLGTHIEDPDHYRRLIEVEPACLITVDVRYPASTLRADGLFPAYVHRFGVVPTLAIPYRYAWDFLDARSARVRIAGGSVPSVSQNVVAELPATLPEEGRGSPTVCSDRDGAAAQPILYASGHHDTQAGSPGADDNATGVAAVIELCRVLAPLPRRRPVRLISFGAEEQLSVGSAAYVRSHRTELERRGGYVCNFDSFGSRLGWFDIHTCAHASAVDWIKARLDASGIFAAYSSEAVPYQDGFPFHAAGIAGHWVYRPNCSAGRFYHHEKDDDCSKIDFAVTASMVEAHARLIAELAGAHTLPFADGVPEPLRADVERYWHDCFGGWTGFAR